MLGSYNKYKKSPFETYYVGGDGMSGYSSYYGEETIGLRGYENGSVSYSQPQVIMLTHTTAFHWSSAIHSSWVIPPFMVWDS